MNISISFIRAFFLMMSVLFFSTYMTQMLPGGLNLTNMVIGVTTGVMFGLALIGADLMILKKFNLRGLNLAILGLFLGYLLGEAVLLVLQAALTMNTMPIMPEALVLLKTIIFLFCAYLGMSMTVKASEEIQLSIPFIKLKAHSQKKKDLLIDWSILSDSRIIDLAASGLLDDYLIIPRFALKELQIMAETGDENAKAKARRCLDVFKKLEGIPGLEMRYSDVDFPESKDSTSKLIQLARMLDANIITADMSRIQQSIVEGIRIINIHMLSNALKPITHAGEFISIKVQRYGKEPRQGVGYLEDGTMVVINGGAEFIGETIKSQVLSVKHTSSGRMIFCNAAEENMMMSPQDAEMMMDQGISMPSGSTHKNYFSL